MFNVQTSPAAEQESIRAPFLELLERDGGGPYQYDLDSTQRFRYIQAQLLLRRGTTNLLEGPAMVPLQFAAQQAIERFYLLCAWALSGISLTAQELAYILNTTRGTYWQWYMHDSVAEMVACDKGIGSLDELPEGSIMRDLLEKLGSLDPLQNAALVDFCERYWRTSPQDEFSEKCAKLGLTLVE